MREQISLWARALEGKAAQARNGKTFAEVRLPNEYVNTLGHDSSILEVVLSLGEAPYRMNIYTRVVWSESHPKDKPFAFVRYIYDPKPKKTPGKVTQNGGVTVIEMDVDDDFDSGKPKQAFYDDKSFASDLLTAAEVEKKLGLAPQTHHRAA